MVEPDRLAFYFNHALFDRLGECGSDRAVIVVAPDQVDGAAANALAIRRRLGQLAPAEIPEDPERVVLRDARVDCREQRRVVAGDGFGGGPWRRTGVAPHFVKFGRRKKRALAILDDVPVTEMCIGGEPGFHGRPRHGSENPIPRFYRPGQGRNAAMSPLLAVAPYAK